MPVRINEQEQRYHQRCAFELGPQPNFSPASESTLETPCKGQHGRAYWAVMVGYDWVTATGLKDACLYDQAKVQATSAATGETPAILHQLECNSDQFG